MRRINRISLLVLLSRSVSITGAPKDATVTYYKDVLPVLQNHCQSCHRANQVAPMSLLSYRETLPWVDAIKHVVTARKMPPLWSEDVRHSPHERGGGLTPHEIYTIVRWAEEGAVEGDPHDAPPPLYFEQARLINREQHNEVKIAPPPPSF